LFNSQGVHGVENPGKSLNWKKKFQDWKVLENQ
jgi:hypothetical protein